MDQEPWREPDFVGPPPPPPLVRWVGPEGGVATHAEMRICPLPLVTAEAAELLRLFPHWEANRMPNAGGLLDQPAGFVAAMQSIREHLDAAEAEDREHRNN